VAAEEALTKQETQEEMAVSAEEAEAVTDKIHLQRVQLEQVTLAAVVVVEDYLHLVELMAVVES
jgi:hypothetical protein